MQQMIAAKFVADAPKIQLEGSRISIRNFQFHSEFRKKRSWKDILPASQSNHDELLAHSYPGNDQFWYPVFLPEEKRIQNKAILLLHGLNERTWDKYFSWANYLAEHTGKAVILFPIAFHMNRSPKKWTNPREMSSVVKERKTTTAGQKEISFANAALSTRLDECPEQFFLSGAQSYQDVVSLLKQITKGKHELFPEGTKVDFFAYSIGAFLSEILFLSNPKGLLKDARLFMFCGGPTFDQMNGASKYIMDNQAFLSLRQMFFYKRNREIRAILKMYGILRFREMWKSFVTMLRIEKKQRKREHFFKKYNHQIYSIALEKDKVMPPDAIDRTLHGRKGNVPVPMEVLDFPFPYSHENPFPVSNNDIAKDVDERFRQVFSKAAAFLS
jgi:hypothetical protein